MELEQSVDRDPSVFQRWLESLASRDPKLHAELSARLNERLTTPESTLALEGVAESVGANPQEIALETMVREGRPALLIQENRIARDSAVIDAASEEVIRRLFEAAPTLEPFIPLVGRIDVANHPTGATYLGTGWVIDRDGDRSIVVTNRHVAELLARPDGARYTFRPGRFGEPLDVSVDTRHEFGVNAVARLPVRRVIWIESDPQKADIAFLEVDRLGTGTSPESIQLAAGDAAANSNVAVVGYPARAPSHIIPNQTWMDEVYRGTYDIKRIAPGLMGDPSRGWATHDCTTLGGNSGSVVLDMKTGKAVALHFAGLYMIENYAVPASTIRKYLTDRPWHRALEAAKPSEASARAKPPEAAPPGRAPAQQNPATSNPCQFAMTIPLTISISIGPPELAGRPGLTVSTSLDKQTSRKATIEDAAGTLFRERKVDGILAVRPGYVIEGGRLTDTECLVVAAHPERMAEVRAAMPASYAGWPVEVRAASVSDQLAGTEIAEEAVTSVMYNDDDRTGEGFSFDAVEENMTVVLHVGPERSWVVLRDFLTSTKKDFVSSIYEFHAEHIADAIEKRLDKGASMTLVMAPQSRDPKKGKVAKGDFDRSQAFERWENDFGDKFDRVFVPIGSQGLVANSYHIKVTVRDGKFVWLSSGNWKRSSQPVISNQSLNDPKATSRAGNREWHVVIENETLARRFANHIRADFERSLELGGTLEAVEEQIFVDVPITMLEAVELEGPAARVLDPVRISRKVRVKPLLTPDKKGAVFSKAVLQLIRSAKKQLLFQNQYIKMAGAGSGFLKQLVDELAKKSKELDDFRIILRSENDSFADDVSALKRRGIDVNQCVRRLSNTHTKGIIVDGKRLLLGSHNWSGLGVTLNRDASLIFDDDEIAQYYVQAFELDWDRANELAVEESIALEAPRLAAGDEPPPGFARMTLSEFLEG